MEFWPFDIESGPDFLGFYFLLMLVALTAAGWLAHVIASRTPAKPFAQPALRAAVPPGQAYRQPGGSPPPRQRLTIGFIPWPDEHWAIAYLRGGNAAVADLLLCTALASGWLVDTGNSMFSLGAPAPHFPLLAQLHAQLARMNQPSIAQTAVRAMATLVAIGAEKDLQAELEAAGFLRSRGARGRARALVWVVGLFVLAVGVIRTVRGISLDHPVAFLIVLMIPVALTTLILGAVVMRRKASTRSASSLPSMAGGRHALPLRRRLPGTPHRGGRGGPLRRRRRRGGGHGGAALHAPADVPRSARRRGLQQRRLELQLVQLRRRRRLRWGRGLRRRRRVRGVTEPAFEVLDALDGFASLVKRSPTLDGAVPVRVARGCAPLLEGNALGFQVVLQPGLRARRRLGRVVVEADAALEARLTRGRSAAVPRLVAHGFLGAGGAWEKRLRKSTAWTEKGRLRVWTVILVRT